MTVKGLLYTKDHEWVSIEGNVATMGITDYAQEQLGELVFVEPPAIDKEVLSWRVRKPPVMFIRP